MKYSHSFIFATSFILIRVAVDPVPAPGTPRAKQKSILLRDEVRRDNGHLVPKKVLVLSYFNIYGFCIISNQCAFLHNSVRTRQVHLNDASNDATQQTEHLSAI